jgi:hypothetical protein
MPNPQAGVMLLITVDRTDAARVERSTKTPPTWKQNEFI